MCSLSDEHGKEGEMAVPETLRMQLLTATVPFILAAANLQGMKRIALFGSLVTTKKEPKDVDLLLTVEDAMHLEPLATLGRKLQGRISMVTRGNYGADLFVADPDHQYCGRLCRHRECPSFRICAASHCGKRPYLRDDLTSVTLFPTLVAAPPLELWPTKVARIAVPFDVEHALLQPLMEQWGLS